MTTEISDFQSEISLRELSAIHIPEIESLFDTKVAFSQSMWM